MGDTWHLDELFVTIQRQRQYLWRAVDQDGDVIDILVRSRRDRRAAAHFFRKLLKGQGRESHRLITDKLRGIVKLTKTDAQDIGTELAKTAVCWHQVRVTLNLMPILTLFVLPTLYPWFGNGRSEGAS